MGVDAINKKDDMKVERQITSEYTFFNSMMILINTDPPQYFYGFFATFVKYF